MIVSTVLRVTAAGMLRTNGRGWQVFETWDSAEAHQKWFQTNIAPNMPPEMASQVDLKYHELYS